MAQPTTAATTEKLNNSNLFPYFLDNRHDNLIKEIFESKTRITILTAPRRFGLTHLAMKMSLMKQIECKEQQRVGIHEMCYCTQSDFRRGWFKSRVELARENFPWIAQDMLAGSLNYILHTENEPNQVYDFLIVDDMDMTPSEILEKLFLSNQSSRIVFMGRALEEDYSSCFQELKEPVQLIRYEMDNQGKYTRQITQ